MTQSRSLDGVTVVIGILKESQDVVNGLLLEAGATVLPQATPGVQFIVANVSGGPSYKAAINLNPQAIAVRPSWVQSCNEHRAQVDCAAHRLLPLAGLHISVSGFVSSRRQPLAEAISAAGATFSADLYKTCTHLVIFGPAKGRKYDFAKKNDMKVVTEQWVRDSIAAGHLLDEADYSLEPGSEAATPTSGTTANTTPATAATTAAPPLPTSFASALSNKHSLSRLEDSLLAGDSSRHSQPTSSTTDPLHPALGGLRPSRAPLSTAGSNSVDSVVSAAVDRWGMGQPHDFDFLDRVKVHLCGCSQPEAAEQLLALREGAATRYPDLVPHLTHIVIGSEATPAQLAAAQQYLKEWRGEAVGVCPSWALACKATRQLLPPHPSWSLTPNDLHVRTLQGVGGAGAGSHSISEPTLGGTEGLGSQGLGPVGGADAPFRGRWFQLAAVRGTEEEQQASDLIRRGGGTICTPSTARAAPSPDKLLAVCPAALPEAAILSLKAQAPGFKEVARANYVNLYWLRSCIEGGTYIPPEEHSLTYSPLPHAVPLKDFRRVVIHCTMYDDPQKYNCHYIVKVLGGSFSDRWTGGVTHLLAAFNDGPKVEQARSLPRFRGVQVVEASWLRDCASRGEMLSVVSYPPPERPGTSGGAGGGGGSQWQPQATQPTASQAMPSTRGALPLSTSSLHGGPLSQRCPLPLSTQSNQGAHRLAAAPAFNPPTSQLPSKRTLPGRSQPSRPVSETTTTPSGSPAPLLNPSSRPASDLDAMLDQHPRRPGQSTHPDTRPGPSRPAAHSAAALQPPTRLSNTAAAPSRPAHDLDALLDQEPHPLAPSSAPSSNPQPSAGQPTASASNGQPTSSSSRQPVTHKIVDALLQSLRDTDDEDGTPAAAPSTSATPVAVLEDATNLRRRSRQASGASLRSKAASTSAGAAAGGGGGPQRQSGNSVGSWGPTVSAAARPSLGAHANGARRSPRLGPHQGAAASASTAAVRLDSAGHATDSRAVEEGMDAQTGSAELDVVERLEGMFKDQPLVGSEDASQLVDPVMLMHSSVAASLSSLGDASGRGTGSGQKDTKRSGSKGGGARKKRRANSPASIQMSQQVGYDTSALAAGMVESSRSRRSRRGAAAGGAEDEHEARMKADLLRKIQQTDTNSARRPDGLQQLGLL